MREEVAIYLAETEKEVEVVDSSSTITIIVGALVAVLAIGIGVNQVNSFASSTSDHSDKSQVQSVIASIQRECERLEEQNELQYSVSEQIELRTTGFDIDNSGSNPVFVFDPGGEADRMAFECASDITFDSNFPGDYDVPSGDHHVSINDDGGELKVEFR